MIIITSYYGWTEWFFTETRMSIAWNPEHPGLTVRKYGDYEEHGIADYTVHYNEDGSIQEFHSF